MQLYSTNYIVYIEVYQKPQSLNLIKINLQLATRASVNQ